MEVKTSLYLLVSVVLVLADNSKIGITQPDQLRREFLILEKDLWLSVNAKVQNGLKESKDPHVDLIKAFQAFGDNIDQKMPGGLNISQLDNVWSWAVAYADLRGINALYESFRRFQALQTGIGRIPSPQQAWFDLANTILNEPKNNINESIDRITHMIVNKHMFTDVLKEVSDMMCSNQQSPQQILYTLYNSISLTELKGYSMVQFSYMLLKLYNKGNFTKEAAQMRSKYEDRTNKAIDTVKQAMKHASREYWKCDPRKHIKGETYEEVTQLLQGYVQNEVDMNPTQTCGENCAEYQYAKSYGCFKNQFCKKQRNCNGKILNCRFVDSDMQICTANPNSGRRYESIEYENGLVYGRKQSCPRGQTKVDSWWRWLFWHCSYCMCLCDEQGPFSDRYINMRAVVADVANNKVVTGLRFVKQNRIIHLQIQEGLLLPFGTIDPDSVHWVPAEDYRIEDYKIYSGQDYHILTWEKRAMDLDDLIADKDHVVTGVRFKEIGSHLNFEIYITPFNFSTGKLHDPLSKSYWKDNPNTDISYPHPRTKVNIYTPDIPTRSPNPSKPLSKSDQYIEFSHTDFERDAAQTTIPFLDAQRLQSIKPVPLSGAGIFYKGNRNFGGFIVPKVITYDFTEHLQPAFPEDLHTLEPTLQTVVEVEPESN